MYRYSCCSVIPCASLGFLGVLFSSCAAEGLRCLRPLQGSAEGLSLAARLCRDGLVRAHRCLELSASTCRALRCLPTSPLHNAVHRFLDMIWRCVSTLSETDRAPQTQTTPGLPNLPRPSPAALQRMRKRWQIMINMTAAREHHIILLQAVWRGRRTLLWRTRVKHVILVRRLRLALQDSFRSSGEHWLAALFVREAAAVVLQNIVRLYLRRLRAAARIRERNAPYPFAGKRVRVKNLSVRTDLNGMIGTAVGWRLDTERYEVKLISGEMAALRPESLELAEAALALDEVNLGLHQVERSISNAPTTVPLPLTFVH